MALYKYPNYLKLSKSTSFDQILPAGLHIPSAGIYRCVGGGNEVGDVDVDVTRNRSREAANEAAAN